MGRQLFSPLVAFILTILTACGGSLQTTPANNPPKANAGNDLIGKSGQTLQLQGAGTDSDGQVTAYVWQQVSGPELATSPAAVAGPQIVLPNVTSDSSILLRLTVTDNDGASSSDEVAIAISPATPIPSAALDAKPDNTTCLAGDRPEIDASITLKRAFAQLPAFSLPVGLLQAPGDNSRWFVVEQGGYVKVFANDASVATTSTFLDLHTSVYRAAQESGLLSIAFHPQFATNGYVYAFYQTKTTEVLSKLSRFKSNDGGQTLDPASRVDLLSYHPPFENHFGGQLGFDAQGYLYLTIGDGGAGGDPGNRGQNTKVWFGKMLRLDVDHGNPYSIPSDNPFAGNAMCVAAASPENTHCPEIFAWGLRNVWRWSFDRATGDIWAGDVGQDVWEEVNIIKKGGNYGWVVREGFHCYPSTVATCSRAGLIDPVAEYNHDVGKSITGGFVYRGQEMPDLIGHYIFGDYVTGRIWGLFTDENGQQKPKELALPGFNIASFAEDPKGELYVLNYGGGSIFRLSAATADGVTVPAKLSQTGCVSVNHPQQVNSGLIPYGLNVPFWSDGAQKQRWMALPNAKNLTASTEGRWEWPVGSVLVKEFRLGDRLVETRLFKHHNDGSWAGYSYAWNDAQTDADYVPGGAKRTIDLGAGNSQTWIFPSGSDCMQCHNAQAGFVLGPEAAQLDKEQLYPQTNRRDNQLNTLSAVGVIPVTPVPAPLVSPLDTTQSLDARARSYLHANCSQCHRPNGPTDVNLDLRITTSFKNTNLCNIAAQNPVSGLENLMRIKPGDKTTSMLWHRMQRRDAQGMPPLGSGKVDDAGVVLLGEWISQLRVCP